MEKKKERKKERKKRKKREKKKEREIEKERRLLSGRSRCLFCLIKKIKRVAGPL